MFTCVLIRVRFDVLFEPGCFLFSLQTYGLQCKGNEPEREDVTKSTTASNDLPQPEPLLRRRSKGPALTRPMTSVALVPPNMPEGVVDPNPTVVNPMEQLKLVDPWLFDWGD